MEQGCYLCYSMAWKEFDGRRKLTKTGEQGCVNQRYKVDIKMTAVLGSVTLQIRVIGGGESYTRLAPLHGKLLPSTVRGGQG